MTGEHPSFFVLDGLRLGLPAAAVRTHLDGCRRCADYVQGGAEPTPSWLTGARLAPTATVPANRPPWWKRPLLLGPGFAALALAAVLVVPFVRAPAPDEAATRAKGGSPALGVFIKRGESVFPWDGRSAVRPDDRLRFEVAPSGYRFVSVALRTGDVSPAVLYAGTLPLSQSFLPIAFRVDDQGRQEVVSVILSNRTIPPRLHAQASEGPSQAPSEIRATGETWRQILVFDKSAPPDARP